MPEGEKHDIGGQRIVWRLARRTQRSRRSAEDEGEARTEDTACTEDF